MRAQGDHLRVRAADDPSSVLAVILDVSLASWIRATGSPDSMDAPARASRAMQSVGEQLAIFLNAFLLLHASNRVLLLITGPTSAELVHPPLSEQDSDAAEDFALFATAPGVDAPASVLDHAAESAAVNDALRNALRTAGATHARGPAALSAALAQSLCLLTRMRRARGDESAPARILTIAPDGGCSEQYVATMNCLFAAQRLGIVVDGLVVNESDSTFLQQGAYLTHGTYARVDPNDTAQMLQTLLTVFLVDRQGRDFIAMPLGDGVDFRASCMQTGAIIDDGYACSVCLSTFDLSVGRGAAMCPVCNARFQARRRLPTRS